MAIYISLETAERLEAKAALCEQRGPVHARELTDLFEVAGEPIEPPYTRATMPGRITRPDD